MAIVSVNPATGETLRTFVAESAAAIEAKIAAAADAFARWRRTRHADRAVLLRRAADLLDAEREPLARLVTLEMGKPLRAARDEIEKCARGCRWFAEHGETLLADVPMDSDATRSFVRHAPLGVVLAVMPWNFPFWQVFRFAAPALMAGNVGLLKHASNVPQCALAIEDVWKRAGAPDGVFQTLLVEGAAVEPLLADPRIAAATLTGSTAAGASVAAAAGRHVKKTVLELGGSDPFVVLPSADLDAAARTAVAARTVNSGQSCIAAKRFVVHADVAAEFERRFVEGMAALRVGEPTDERTDVGPLATARIRDDVEAQVAASLRAGGCCSLGGERLPGPGFFYPPTVLRDVPPDAPALADEVFGPVAAVVVARDVDEAIRLANATAFGLGASVWTRDAAEEARLVDEIEAGMVFVNGQVASHPALPFGGVKASGYGRELGPHGLREFVNVKTIWVGPRRT